MNKKKNLKKILFVLSALFLVILAVSLIVLAILRNQQKAYSLGSPEQLKGYKSYILKLDNPTVESASELIKSAILKEARDCNCLSKGYPKDEIVERGFNYMYNSTTFHRIKFDDSACSFVDFPSGTSAVAPMIEVYVLPKGIKALVTNLRRFRLKTEV